MVSAFEQKRLDNIAAQERDMLEMGIGGPDGISVTKIAPKPAKKAKAAPRAKKETAPVERRMSSRQLAQKEDQIPRDAAGNPLDEEEIARLEMEAENERLAEEAAAKARRHAKRTIAANQSIALAGTTQTLNALLSNLAIGNPAARGKRERSPELSGDPTPHSVPIPRTMSAKEAAQADAQLERGLAKLVLRGITKVVPERVYSLVVHPSVDKDLVFVGDKTGNIGLWDATEAGLPLGKGKEKAIKSNGEPEVRMGMTWSWQAHGKNSVSCLKIEPTRSTSIFSSAYDCTVRKMEFENQVSEEVIDVNQLTTTECLVSSFDITLDGNSIWATDTGGGITHRDLRQKMGTTKRWTVDKAKLGCISLNPLNQNLAVTSHNSRRIRIWDLRNLGSLAEVAITSITDTASIVSSIHDLSASGCYWDSTGTKLASTCYDNNLRLWTGVDAVDPSNIVDPFNPEFKIHFDTQTGRYLTVLKPQWSQVPTLASHFMCGSMDRRIALFSGTSGRMLGELYDPVQITAVPTVVGAHPSLPNRYYGATASGKVSFFGLLDGSSTGEDEDQEMVVSEDSSESVKEETVEKRTPSKRAKR